MSARKRPVMGFVGFNFELFVHRHFSSSEAAQEAFDKYLDDVRQSYCRSFGERWIEEREEITKQGTKQGCELTVRIRFINILKSGKKGKIIHTVQMYTIPESQVERYLADPFYGMEI